MRGFVANALEVHPLFSWELSAFGLGLCIACILQTEVLNGVQIMKLHISDASGHLTMGLTPCSPE